MGVWYWVLVFSLPVLFGVGFFVGFKFGGIGTENLITAYDEWGKCLDLLRKTHERLEVVEAEYKKLAAAYNQMKAERDDLRRGQPTGGIN